MGSYLSILNDTDDTYLVKVGPDEAALRIATMVAVAILPLAASLSAVAAVGILAAKLEDAGYVEIGPGQTERFGKYSLSLWRQATCVRIRPDPDNLEQLVIDTVYMRPIFSGATADSNLTHNIQYWINRFGHENRMSFKLAPQNESPFGKCC